MIEGTAGRHRNRTFDPEALSPVLGARYDLAPPIRCEFIRRGFNDHYRIWTADGRYVFRIYLNGKYYLSGEADIRFELALLDHLSREGVPVSRPIAGKDGELLGMLADGTEERPFALFSYAEGESTRPLTVEQARPLGDTMARLHLTSDRFRSIHPRYHLDLRYLLDEPVAQIGRLLYENRKGDLSAYMPRLEEIRRRIRALPTGGGAYGYIHGDPHGGNMHFTAANEVTLFDFDHGGFGWRAYDLAVCRDSMDDAGWPEFLAAYEDRRPLSGAEVESIPLFRKIRPIWDLGDILAMQAAWGEDPDGETFDEAYCDRVIERLEGLSQGTT